MPAGSGSGLGRLQKSIDTGSILKKPKKKKNGKKK